HGGEGGIRTREAVFSRLRAFQARSFGRSDTSPMQRPRPLRRLGVGQRAVGDSSETVAPAEELPRATRSGGWRRGRDSNPRSSVNPIPVFETGPFSRSGTSPDLDPCSDRRRGRAATRFGARRTTPRAARGTPVPPSLRRRGDFGQGSATG